MINETQPDYFQANPQRKMTNQRKFKVECNQANLKTNLVKRSEIRAWDSDWNLKHVTDANIREFSNSVSSSKALQELNVIFAGCENLTGKGLATFCNSFKNHGHFKKVDLTLGARNKFDPNVLGLLGKGLKRLHYLQDLRITLNHYYDMEDGSLSSLFHQLKALVSLQNFNIELRPSKITDRGLVSLASFLERLTSLKSLTVHMLSEWGHAGYTDAGLERLAEAIKKQTSLESVRLELRSPSITGAGISRIKQSLEGLVNLKKIHLGFPEASQLTEIAPSDFSKLTSLKKLSFDFENCRALSSQTFSNWGQTLQGLDSLECLRLQLYNCRSIQNVDFSSWNQAFTRFTSLQFLDLYLHKCKNLTTQDLSGLSEALQKAVSLQILILDVEICEKLEDDALISLGQALKHLPALEETSFKFGDCPLITDTGVIGLSEGIKHLKSGKRMTLYLRNCPEITDKGAIAIKEALAEIPSFTNIHLEFPKCKVTDAAFVEFGRLAETIKSVEYYQLNICRIPVTDGALQNWLDSLKKLTAPKFIVLNITQCQSLTRSELERAQTELKLLFPSAYISLH